MFSSYSMKPDFTCVEEKKKSSTQFLRHVPTLKVKIFRDFQDPFARMWFLVAHFFYAFFFFASSRIHWRSECRVCKLHMARAIRSTFLRTSFIIVSLVYGRFSTVNRYYAKPYCTSIIPEMWLSLALFVLSAHPSDRPHLRLCLLKGFKGDRIRHLATDYYLAFKRLNFRCDHPKRTTIIIIKESINNPKMCSRESCSFSMINVCPYEKKKHNFELLFCCFIPFLQDDFINYDCRS